MTQGLTKEQFSEFFIKGLEAEGITTPADVAAKLDQYLAFGPHLKEHRGELLDIALARIVTTVGRAEELVDDEKVRWLQKDTMASWMHWPWLSAYLKEFVRRPTRVMTELDESSTNLIDLLGNPNRPGLWERRGMVVGHVQSGKTQHYTAVIAKALDAGFKLVIVLSGIHENLRQQTQERVEEYIIGKNSRDGFKHFGIRAWSGRRLKYKIPGDPAVPLPDIHTMTSVEGDYGAAANRAYHVTPGHTPVILVVKKNVSILGNLLEWVVSIENKAPLTVPTLVIDDEADHSSINTAAIDPETDPTKINRLIRCLLWCCNRVGYIGYTATPYANIFIDDKRVDKPVTRDVREPKQLKKVGSDLFPRSFIISLDAPSNYIGPDIVFGHPGDDSAGIVAREALPMHLTVDDAEAWLPPKHKKDFTVTADLPASLREALRCFLLVVAGRMAIGQNKEHTSMLVHVSRFNDVQEKVVKHIEGELSALNERLRHGANPKKDWKELQEIWERVIAAKFTAFANHPSQQLIKPVLPKWSKVEAQVLDAFERISFANINSNTKENLDYRAHDDGYIVVAVGGDRLSRGLTLEGLSISYFLRGARAFDTLMQMGRWFGYRPGYAHLCRVWSPESSLINFRTIALATEELRREFSRMAFLGKTPADYGLRVREPRADLLVTALNKMRRGETVRVHFADSLVSSLVIPRAAFQGNYNTFTELIGKLEKKHGIPEATHDSAAGTKNSYHHRWEKVDAADVIRFFRTYRASNNVCFDEIAGGTTMIATFVENMQKAGELNEWTVALISSSQTKRKAIEGRPYNVVNRTLSEDEKTHYAFQGVAVGQEESIDLTPSELSKANEQYDKMKMEPRRPPKAAFYRHNRPHARGLLLLYAIAPLRKNGAETEDKDPLIGVAVSLPSSINDAGVEYVCNPRMLRELFGNRFAEDLERDAQEDALASAATTT